MTSSVGARRQHMYDGRKPSISAERLDSASVSGSPARLQSHQRNDKPVLSDAQMQNTSEVEVNSTEGRGEEVDGQQQEKEGGEGEEQKEREILRQAMKELEDAEGKEQKERETLRQVMKDLEDATGFGSYKSYLESFRRDPMYVGRSYTDILNGCFSFDNHINGSPGVDIIDVSNEDLSPVGVRLRCENLSASEISEALSHPPPSTRAQIVLWPITIYANGIEDFLDVLGVGLQLDPCLFEVLRWREDETRFTHHFRSKNILSIRSIGTSVFVARRFVLAQDNPVPVVLIAGPMHEPVVALNNGSYPNKAIYDLVQAAPIYAHYKCDGKPRFANAYIRALFSLLTSGRDSVLSLSDTLSACIIPLLQIEIAICKAELDALSRSFNELKGSSYNVFAFKTRYRGRYEICRDRALPHGEAPEHLYRTRTKLRSWVEYFKNQKGALMVLLSSLTGPNVTEGLFYPQIKEESMSIIEEASQLEAEIRDHLQLQGSKLALLESKKSIEVSNRQIYEGKRVKIFTVLAFFYVPLNLATSVFGMNLQQLNRSGTSIGVFLGTAAILLFVTGVSWLFIEGVQDGRVLLRRLEEEDIFSVATENHSISIRLYLIWWLGKKGLFAWMIRTGAAWCLLVNSSMGFQPSGMLSDLTGCRVTEVVLRIVSEMPDWKARLNGDKGRWLPKRKASRIPSRAGSYDS